CVPHPFGVSVDARRCSSQPAAASSATRLTKTLFTSLSIWIGSQKEGAILTQFFFHAPLFFARKAFSNPRLVIA
ncbi:MAG: hypothetical protein ABW072_11220, partial [Sedimenticola sp.]